MRSKVRCFYVSGFLMFLVGRLFVPRAPVASQASGLPRGSGKFLPPPYSRPLRPFGSEGFRSARWLRRLSFPSEYFYFSRTGGLGRFRHTTSASFEGVAGGSKTGRTIEKQLRGFSPKWPRLFCDRWLRFVIAVGHVICPRTSPLVQPVSRHIGLGLLVTRSCYAWP